IIVLSARNEERLRTYAQKLLAYLKANSDVSLVELAYTLQVGREAMACRLAVVVTDLSALREKLTTYLAGEAAEVWGYQGEVQPEGGRRNFFKDDEDAQHLITLWLNKGKLEKLAEVWVEGVEIDWSLLYSQQKPKRISLPTYPFARERYWLRPRQPLDNSHALWGVPPAMTAQLGGRVSLKSLQPPAHPFFFAGQERQPGQFEYRLSLADNRLLREHTVFGWPVLPTDSLLELIYEAATAYLQTDQLEFEQLFLHRPLLGLADQATTVRLAFGNKGAAVPFELCSRVEGLGQTLTPNVTGTVRPHQHPVETEQTYQKLLTEFDRRVLGQVLFSEDYPLQIGDFFRSLQEVYLTEDQAVGVLRLAEAAQASRPQFLLNPSIVDGLLGSAVCLAEYILSVTTGKRERDYTFIPIYIDKVHIAQRLVDEVYFSHVKLVKQAETFIRFDVALIDQQGQVVLRLDGLDEKRISLADIERSVAEVSQAADRPAQATSELLAEMALPKVTAGEVSDPLLPQLRRLLSQTLLLPEEKIKDSANLIELGFDSILGMEFVQKINRHFEIKLKGTALYEYTTLAKLTEYLGQTYGPQLRQEQPTPAVDLTEVKSIQPLNQLKSAVSQSETMVGPVEQSKSIPVAAGVRSRDNRDIAVIGLACRFPEADTPEDFWRLIAAGRYLLTDVPPARRTAWRQPELAEVYCQKGSFINHID
ncbi:MAG: polyketide synthase dehydratase domain-containing protein, partial [Anaerolineae bacterium]|nr:polyketide synthase dehydratase domain-containing protein [Anaerolineae bacterium]